jgi:glycosyltransferase involved in cell wall biosynthesis
MVREQGLENVIMVSDIPSLERDALYKAASALLFPSRCEGFGSPIMEAMSQGCPPIAWRDAGPTKELVASAVPLLDKLDPEEIVVRMIEYATLSCSARVELADRLVEQSKVFVGEDFGREFYEAMVETSKAEGEIIR